MSAPPPGIGFARFADFYVLRARDGHLNLAPDIKVVADAPAAATIDGDGALDEARIHLDDDLDVPAVLKVIDDAAAAGDGVSAAAALLGVELAR